MTAHSSSGVWGFRWPFSFLGHPAEYLARQHTGGGRCWGTPLPSPFCSDDRTGGALAGRLRPGNATANDTPDLLGVVDDAICQLPTHVAASHRLGDDPGVGVSNADAGVFGSKAAGTLCVREGDYPTELAS